MRYYSTQRPVAPGTYPMPEGNWILEIHNFDEKTCCSEPGRDCWGYIDYEKSLTEKEANAYELVRERIMDLVFELAESAYELQCGSVDPNMEGYIQREIAAADAAVGEPALASA